MVSKIPNVIAETEGILEGGSGGLTLRATEWQKRSIQKQGSRMVGGGGGDMGPMQEIVGEKYHLNI